MAVLRDDWSPYLTLAAAFDSLDNLLEEPDIQYSANQEMLQEYLHEPEKYVKKIQQTIKAYSSVMALDNSQSFAEHVKVIKESKGNFGKESENSQNMNETNFLHLREF